MRPATGGAGRVIMMARDATIRRSRLGDEALPLLDTHNQRTTAV
jgi:hypothetical protein